MSHRETATRPASRQPTHSPVISPELANQPGRQFADDHSFCGEDAAKPKPNDSNVVHQHIPPKSLGMLNILNPSGPRQDGSQTPYDAFSKLGQSGSTYSTGERDAPRQSGPGHSAPLSYPGTSTGNMGSVGASPNLSSPSTHFPYPNLTEPRRFLSPKMPRPASLNFISGPRRDSDPRTQTYVPAISPAKRPLDSGTTEEPRDLRNLHRTPGLISAAGSPLTPPLPRSLSQPTIGPLEVHQGATRAVVPRETQGLTYTHVQVGQGPSSRQPAAVGRPSEASESWTEVLRRSRIVGHERGEGQQAFMTLPGSDTPIPVQVDYSQASRQADEKRQRNAKASTRHRRKKKTLQEENIRQLQELKDERQSLADEVETLRRQRDFYRDERNRLRDVVCRTPGIHQHAIGPPSPTPTRSTGSHTDHSPISQNHHAQMSGQVFVPPPPVSERQGHGGRLEDRLSFSNLEFPPGMTHAGVVSPLGQPSGGHGHRSPSYTVASGEKLPPLRALEGQASNAQYVATGHADEQDPRTGQWRPVPPKHIETGWATASKSPAGHGPPPPW